MTLRLNGSTSGYVEIDAPAAAGSNTLVLPTNNGSSGDYLRTDGSGGLSWQTVATGKILQVVQGSTSTQVYINTTTYTDSGLSASITPTSSTSKVLVLVDQQIQLYRAANTQYAGMRLYRDSTIIYNPAADATGPSDFAISVAGSTGVRLHSRTIMSVLDSPGSTSSLTYKTQGRPYYSSDNGELIFNRNGGSVSATSYITLLEVAA